jgi:hypothetical protein
LIQPPNDLNSDQIKLMMWLYENRNNGNAKLSLELNDAYESLSDSLKLLLSEKFPISKLLKSGVEVELEPVPQQQPEQEQPQLPQQVQQEAELIQPQVPEQVQPEGQQAPRQPSLWQRWLNLFRTRQWTAPS